MTDKERKELLTRLTNKMLLELSLKNVTKVYNLAYELKEEEAETK